MASNLPTIQPFDAGSNPPEAWRNWKQDFEDYVEALRYGNETEKTKTALFRHVCGDELKKQYRAFNLKPASGSTEVSLKQILDEFGKYFQDYQNEIYASFKFLEMKQENGEKFTDFYLRLKSAVNECNYGELEDRMLRDKIIQGLQDKPLQERLIRETSRKAKTLQEVVSECRTAEHSKAQASEMNVNKNIAIDSIERGSSRTVSSRREFGARNENRYMCRSCGTIHEPRKCPAFGTVCRLCKLRNHWAKVCRSRGKYQNKIKHVNAVEEDDEVSDSELVFLGELKTIDSLSGDNSESVWHQDIIVNGNCVTFKLDTGAQVNVIPKSKILKWPNKPTVKKCKQTVLDYSDNLVPVIGECKLNCKIKNKEENLRFLITELESSPILSLQACSKLGLIKRLYQIKENISGLGETPEQVIKEFSDVFTGIGRLNRTVKIKLKDNCVPHIAAARKVPLALHDKVKEELKRMEDTGIITKVEEPTEWVSNMVIVNTPKKLRICLDPRPLNEAIKRPHYPIPTADSLITKLQGSKIFTMLDAKNGFWQLPLDEQSSLLTTFATPWGRYRFCVLPFGLNNGPEEFQKAMDEIFERELKVNPYFDDVALGSASVTEHCQLLRRVLTIARRANLKFNLEKTQLALSSVNYLGHIISDKGVQPDPLKVKAINGFAAPQNREDLQRFLGMITYLSKFTPHLSNLTHSLRQLLKQDAEWIWDQNIQRDFEVIKNTIVHAPCLQYFDDKKAVTISVDASKNGIGAVLLQDSQPVAFGSISLTETQQRYAQIEKELLAVVYGLEHFNYYTYGRPVVVQTDHKPLLGLSKKPYDSISPRLQRMLLRLNRYNISLTYVPGKQLIIADALSRAQLPETLCDEETRKEIQARVCLLTSASSPKWDEYSKLFANDADLQDVKYHIDNGWPQKSNTRIGAKAFWHCKDELYATEDGIICRGQRLIIPSEARGEILNKLHVSHRGIVACKSKAREYFYWPSMNTDIEEYVGRCRICQENQRSNQKETLLEGNLPKRPWQKVACDFLQVKGRQYMLMIDYFSKYIEIQLMSNTNSNCVISAIKSIFARHGIPEEIISDGGPPFNSDAVKIFFKEWGVSHNITSPHFPRANGQVERAIQTFKNTLVKAEQDGKDLYMVLLDYRIQPSNDLPSPAELLMGRRLRSFLPSHPNVLQPKFEIKEASLALKKRQEKQKSYADRHAMEQPALTNNTNVWFRHKMNEPWKQGTIIQVGPQPRSYLIQGKNGGKYRRNRYFIKPDKSVNCPSDCSNAILPRNVEDFYPVPKVSNTDKLQLSLPPKDNQVGTVSDTNNIRKSHRNIVKPLRYRNI